MRGWRTDWASASDRPERGDAGSGLGESERDSSLSSVDLQAETRPECFLHAAFLMILSRDGPSTRPLRDWPPRVCEADISSSSSSSSSSSWSCRFHLHFVSLFIPSSILIAISLPM